MPYKWWLLLAISISAFLINTDYTAVNLILIPISNEYAATLSTTKWLLTAYVLFWMFFIFPGGRAADRFGHKNLIIGGMVIFALASLIAVCVNSIEVLIAARALQGIGGALFLPSLYVLISQSFASDEQSTAMGFLSIGVGFGAAIGPFLGGTLLTYFGWRSIFLINIPICLFVIAVLAKNKQPKTSPAITQAVKKPIKQLLKNIPYLCCVLCFFIEQYGFACIVVGAGLYLQQIQRLNSFQASVIFLPMTLTFGLISVIAGRWFDRYGIKNAVIFGLAIMALASFSFSQLSFHSSHTQITTIMLTAGIGMGIAFAALNLGIIKTVEPQLVGISSSIFAIFALAGNFIGATVTVYLYEVSGITAAMIVNGILLLTAVACAMFMLSSPKKINKLSTS